MNYFNDVIKYISTRLYDLSGLKTTVVSNNRRIVQFVTNNRSLRSINIYRITSLDELDAYTELIRQDLIRPTTT